jgi:hypothetical protein
VGFAVAGRVEDPNLPIVTRPCPDEGAPASIKVHNTILKIDIVHIIQDMMYGTQGLRKKRSNVYIMHMQSVQSACRVSDLQKQRASTQCGV